MTVLPSTFAFTGHGYGHGVGLSQYGARGRAIAGQDAPEILAHYFAGTTWSSTDPDRNVRVLLLAGFAPTSASPLKVYGRRGPWTLDGVPKTFPRDALLRVWKTTSGTTTTWRYRVTAPDGTTLHSATTSGDLRMRPASPATRLQLWSKPSSFDTYRGWLRILARTKVDVINHVALDQYLRGVVPAEMPASWPAAALRAQSVAARSYTARRLHPDSGTWDVYDDTRSQVYRGLEAEQLTTDAAILATRGVVLRDGTTIANTFFHSSAGGWTEHNENVWTSSTGKKVAGPVSYLRGVRDVAPDGTAYDAGSPWYRWTTARITRSQLSTILGRDARTAVGSVTKLDLSSRGVSGRLIKVTITGTSGTKVVSGEVFRSVYNAGRPAGTPLMRSTLVYAVSGS